MPLFVCNMGALPTQERVETRAATDLPIRKRMLLLS